MLFVVYSSNIKHIYIFVEFLETFALTISTDLNNNPRSHYFETIMFFDNPRRDTRPQVEDVYKKPRTLSNFSANISVHRGLSEIVKEDGPVASHFNYNQKL